MVEVKWEKIEGKDIFQNDSKYDLQIFGARAKLPEGWLIHYSNQTGSHMFFVPDPNQEWQ